MLLERFEDAGLSQYSYAVGCEGTREVAIVDPRRDVDLYVEWAARRHFAITHVFETHIHADFASGAGELAARAGAELMLSAYDEGELYEVSFPHKPTKTGDAVELGRIRIEARHTPGHTPEHLSFLVYDGARNPTVPIAMLSGDFLFVGSLGRPDLLGEEAKRGLARQLFSSVQALRDLPGGLEILPGHGAGSMCGAGMSGRPHSTLGFERVANPYLDPGLTADSFVEKILGNVPPFPPYYRRMKVLNSVGPRRLDGVPGMHALAPAQVAEWLDNGAVVVDLRDQLAFGAGHLPGAIGAGVQGSISTWAAWMVPYETPLVLVGDSERAVETGARCLARVGLDEIEGYLDGGFDSWMESGRASEQLPQIAPEALSERLESEAAPFVLDIRTESEWGSGHIEGAHHLMGGWILEQREQLPASDQEIAVVCAGGYRSTVIASVLAREGYSRLFNVTGGMAAWKRAGLPVV